MEQLSNSTAHSYRHRLGGIDIADLIASLAALQLIPENSANVAQLEATVQLSCQLPFKERPRALTPKRLRAWLSNSPFGLGLYDNNLETLTEEIPFVGGSYIVFPGHTEQDIYALRRLACAVVHAKALFQAPSERQEAICLIGNTLRLTDTVAKRLILPRGVLPKESSTIVVPSSKRLSEAANATRFTSIQLDELSSEFLGWSSLMPLIQPILDVPDAEEFGSDSFLARPFIEIENDLILALPHEIVPALNHAVISLFVNAGLAPLLSEALGEIIGARIGNDLHQLGWDQIGVNLPPENPALPGHSSVWAIDSDKLAHVLLVRDQLENYNPAVIFDQWVAPQLSSLIEERINDVERELYALQRAPNDVLHLVLISSMGRDYFVSLGDRPDELIGKILILDVGDLEILSLLYNDPVTLWKYALAHHCVRETTQIIALSPLGEFDLYRSHHHSYYISDDEPIKTLSIMMDGAALRGLVRDSYDFHGAAFPRRKTFGTVALLYGERRIPLYTDFPPGYTPEVLVDAFDFPVWVIAEDIPKDRYRSLAAQVTDCVAYWLWQLAPGIKKLNLMAPYDENGMIVSVRIEPGQSWFQHSNDLFDNSSVTIESIGAELIATFSAGFTNGAAMSDNTADRVIVRNLITALLDVNQKQLPVSKVESLVDSIAPLGLKKKMYVLYPDDDPRFDNSGLPDFRSVQEADESKLLDDLGEHLANSGFVVGSLDKTQTQKALHSAVSFYFSRLEDLVATLSPERLMECLISFNEAVVSQQRLRERQVPTEIECFVGNSEMINKLRAELPTVTRAAIASRFLIEYVAARPPTGIRPISQQVYDELLTIAFEIFNKGLMSDLINYDLTSPEVSILPSRRLGIEQGTQWDKGRESYLQLQARSEIARRRERYPAARGGTSATSSGMMDELDRAIAEEFDLSLREFLSFHTELINAGRAISGEPKKALLEDLRRELSVTLGWPIGKVDLAIELHSLRQRPDYLTQPAGFKDWEVYPWIFNRSLSYMRRPIILRDTPRGVEAIWGVRHTYMASRFFLDLCTGGRLHATKKNLVKIINSWRQIDAREFNDKVADLYRQQSDLLVEVRVKKIGGHRIERSPGQDLSDIDVLVVNPQKREILLIETKALVIGRTASELKNEQLDTFKGRNGKLSEIDKLYDLEIWAKNHRSEILQHFELKSNRAAKWKVRSVMIIENELMTPFLLDLRIPVLTLHDLNYKIGAGDLV